MKNVIMKLKEKFNSRNTSKKGNSDKIKSDILVHEVQNVYANHMQRFTNTDFLFRKSLEFISEPRMVLGNTIRFELDKETLYLPYTWITYTCPYTKDTIKLIKWASFDWRFPNAKFAIVHERIISNENKVA